MLVVKDAIALRERDTSEREKRNEERDAFHLVEVFKFVCEVVGTVFAFIHVKTGIV